jgi:hypothetical protein
MNRIKQFVLLLCIYLTTGISSAFAQTTQPEPDKEEKIRALEVAFISRKLNLSTDEAQKFWPVYNEYKTEMRGVIGPKNKRKEIDVLDKEEKVLVVRKKYNDRFKQAVGENKTNQFFQAEHEFRGVLLNRIKKAPANRPGIKQRMKK